MNTETRQYTITADKEWLNKFENVFDEFVKPIEEKKPLFITEDSKELWNKEDKVYSVCPKGTWEKLDTLTAGYLAGIGRKGVHGRPFSNWKHFSTPELCDEYILQNKPVLSYNDVMEFTICKGIGTYLSTAEIERLKELVKSKL